MVIGVSYFTVEQLTTLTTEMDLHYRISIYAIVLLTLIAAIRSDVPQNRGKWHDPCGAGVTSGIEPRIPKNKKMWNEELADSLVRIQKQLNITITHYQKQMFDGSYKDIGKGLDEHQHELKWLPGEGNVRMHYEKPTRRKVSSYLPSLDTELQKFAVAMEAVIQADPKSVSLNETNNYLIQLLCEVEGVMGVLQIGLPPREERDVMTEVQTQEKDYTIRRTRHWGILIKYRNYLHCWRKLLLKMERRRVKPKREQKPKRTQ